MKTTHITATRKQQRTVTKHLKALGVKASNQAVKGVNGWITLVAPLSVKKPLKSIVVSLTGKAVQVLIK